VDEAGLARFTFNVVCCKAACFFFCSAFSCAALNLAARSRIARCLVASDSTEDDLCDEVFPGATEASRAFGFSFC
jgi:hypothetical protein